MVLDLNAAEVFARDTVECGDSAIIEEAGRDSARRVFLLMLLVIAMHQMILHTGKSEGFIDNNGQCEWRLLSSSDL